MPVLNLTDFKKQILNEGLWVITGNIAVALATLFGVRLLTEYLRPEVLGSVNLLVGVTILGINFFCNPFIQAASRFHPEADQSGEIRHLRDTIQNLLFKTTSILVICILIGGAAFTLLRNISYWMFIILAFLVIAEVSRNFEISLFSAARRQKIVALWQSIEAWARPLLAILFVFILGASSQSVILGYLAATGGILLCAHLLPFKFEGTENSEKNAESYSYQKADIVRYALPLAPLAFVGWIEALGDRYIIAKILSVEQVGIYAVAYGLISCPFLFAFGVFHKTLRPIYNQAVSSNNKSLEKKVFGFWFLSVSVFSVLGVIGAFFFRNWIAFFLLAEEYRAASILMPWIAAGMCFQVISQLFENVLFAYKQTKLIFPIHLAGSIVCIVSVFILIRQFGLLGAAIACPVYFLTILILSMILAKKKIKLRQQ